MDDFADRTINELVESHSLFVCALKDEYNVISPMIDIIFSSGFMITEKIHKTFDCFFEYHIY